MAWHAPRRFVPEELVREPCLKHGEATIFGHALRKCEGLLGMAVEVERAMDEAGARLLKVPPLHLESIDMSDRVRPRHSKLKVHPVASVVSAARPADPAASRAPPRVVGTGAERRGVISHRASLVRERGVPIILGMLEATTVIPGGSRVAVDGVAAIAR